MMTEELQVSAKNEPLFGLRAEPKMKTMKNYENCDNGDNCGGYNRRPDNDIGRARGMSRVEFNEDPRCRQLRCRGVFIEKVEVQTETAEEWRKLNKT